MAAGTSETPPYRRFIPNDGREVEASMLREVGVSSIADLFADVPRGVLLSRELSISDAVDEISLAREVREVQS